MPCASPASWMKWRTATKITAAGRVKSSVCAASARMASVSRRSAPRYWHTPSPAAGQQRAGVRQDQRVTVHVHHPRLGGDGLGHLVGTAGGRQARADIQELPDHALPGQVANRAGEEGTVGACSGGHLGAASSDLSGDPAVSRIMVFAPEPYVVDPGRVSDPRVEPGRCDVASCRPCLVLVCARSWSHAGDATDGSRPM